MHRHHEYRPIAADHEFLLFIELQLDPCTTAVTGVVAGVSPFGDDAFQTQPLNACDYLLRCRGVLLTPAHQSSSTRQAGAFVAPRVAVASVHRHTTLQFLCKVVDQEHRGWRYRIPRALLHHEESRAIGRNIVLAWLERGPNDITRSQHP